MCLYQADRDSSDTNPMEAHSEDNVGPRPPEGIAVGRREEGPGWEMKPLVRLIVLSGLDGHTLGEGFGATTSVL